jgi:hypothetical protein
MRICSLIILAPLALVIGCSSTVSTIKTKAAASSVQQVDSAKVKDVNISELHESFLQSRDQSQFYRTVVDITGEVVAFSLTKDNLYTVTLHDGNQDAVCIFEPSVADSIGEGRTVSKGNTITVRGVCYASGLFSPNTFTLDGCQIVTQ